MMKRGTKIYLTSLVLAYILPFMLFSRTFTLFSNIPYKKEISAYAESVRQFFTPAKSADDSINESKLGDLLIALKGGEYDMGYIDKDEQGRSYALPLKQLYSYPMSVYVKDFALTKTKITNRQFDHYLVSAGLPAREAPDESEPTPPDDAPAEVTYAQAESYCRWLGERVGQKAGLPDRIEWEYAARNGGKRVLFPTDNGVIDIGRNVASAAQKIVANSTGSSLDQQLMPVGQFPPTPLGFYDMASNGFEWTAVHRNRSFITSQTILMEGGAATITFGPSENLKSRYAFRCATWSESHSQPENQE
ncbi:formylglycine-generating enzyme family protein [Brenneria izadpanahii]|uniref:Formylglycine-generating enzyme family protein n=1 Tax=Brenneria izadpanahii TaxID=2722756 RepID=A0ABX7UVE6_9GAMM|nr:SUMF1/EgtB/PvdO family nonheme iron enzyme [Brenneria izadpanahii]QTF08532.1 formylglycine-generating enzyme family protein [Brenneria izadpanahii]